MIIRVLALLCGLLLSAGPAAAADWQPFSNSDFGVSTTMPGAPQVTTDGTPTALNAEGHANLSALLIVTEKRVYMVRADVFTPNPSISLRQLLNYTVDQVSTPERGPVAYRAETTVQGYPAIDVVFGPDADGAYIRDRLIAKDGVLVQLISASDSLPPLDRFYTDFKFLP